VKPRPLWWGEYTPLSVSPYSKPRLGRGSRGLIFIFIIIVFALFQTTILYYINIFNAKPDLLLISMLVASLFFKLKSAIFLSIFAGILKDVLSVNTFGINTLLFPLWSILIIRLSKEISLDNNYIRMALIFIIANLHDIITIAILSFLGNIIYWRPFLRIAFIGSLYTTFVLSVILRIIRLVFAALNRTPLTPAL